MKYLITALVLFLMLGAITNTVGASENMDSILFDEQNPRSKTPNSSPPSEDVLVDEFLDGKQGQIPAKGVIPNERTAISVAEAVLIPVYGENTVKEERPYKARLNDGVWTVRGKLTDANHLKEQIVLRGTSYVRIAQRTGEVLLIAHDQ